MAIVVACGRVDVVAVGFGVVAVDVDVGGGGVIVVVVVVVKGSRQGTCTCHMCRTLSLATW